MFTNTLAKLAIGSLDDVQIAVEATYNPKDLTQQRTVPWSSDKHAGHTKFQTEFTGTEPRTMELEMLFDAYEIAGGSVTDQLETLEVLATVRDMTAPEESKRRPHYCVVTWGERGMRPLRCVIESLTTKVTMFGVDGTPKRAVANVKVREISIGSEYESAVRTRMDRIRAALDLE